MPRACRSSRINLRWRDCRKECRPSQRRPDLSRCALFQPSEPTQAGNVEKTGAGPWSAPVFSFWDIHKA